MRLESLQYFVVTADCRSMTLSSKVLHVSQQCISKEIKQLENELAVQLFVRSKSGVALTADGAQAYQKASHILQEVGALSQLFSHQPPECTLSLGSYIGYKRHIETILSIFGGLHPEIVVEEYYSSTEQLEHELQSQSIDLALRQLEKDSITDGALPAGYEHIILLEEPAQLLANTTPANASLTSFSLTRLAEYPILFYCDSTQEIPLYQRIAKRYCDQLNVLYKGNNLEKSWNLFKNKNAIVIITKSLSIMTPNILSTHFVPLEEDIPISTILSVKSELLSAPGPSDLADIAQAFFQQFAS